jgi:plasmid stabilization system protein ParE
VHEICVLLSAEIDLQELYSRLLEINPGRAGEFQESVEIALRDLESHPRLGSNFGGRYRRILLLPLPIGIFYSVEGNRIFIHAVLDVRQDPDAIRRRLGA